MNNYEAADEIVTIIPKAIIEISNTQTLQNSFAIIQVFTGHIKRFIEAGNLLMTDKCLRVMEKIHDRGDTLLKTAVENIFVFSLYNITACCNISERRLIMRKMPIGLYTAYVNQIYKSGI